MHRTLLLVLLLGAGCGRARSSPPAAPPPRAAPAPPEALEAPGIYVPQETRLRPFRVEGPIRRGPYVQSVGMTQGTVCFETVEAVAGTVSCDGRTWTSPPGLRHEVAISGLKPGTRYPYTVEPGGLGGSFKTPPEGDSELFFIAWGDCRTYYDRLARVAALAARDLPDFTVHSGDMVDEGSVEEDWDRFFAAARPLLCTGALWPAMGNHEHGARQYLDLFVLPEPRRWYTFTAGPAQFFILDSNWDVRKDPKQRAWFEEELRKCTARFRFVVTHHPFVSCPDDDFIFEKDTSMYALYGKLIEDAKVTAVIQGHNHNYQRAERKGILYLTSGGAGAPLYSVGELTPETKAAREVHHYVRIRLSGRTLSLEAVDWNGQVFDRDVRQVGP